MYLCASDWSQGNVDERYLEEWKDKERARLFDLIAKLRADRPKVVHTLSLFLSFEIFV
jgi:hypothetical protein